MKYLAEIIIITTLLLFASNISFGQKEIAKKDTSSINLLHRGTFVTTIWFGMEYCAQYQIGFRKRKSSFLMGLGPGFYKQYFDDKIFFSGISTSMEYNYGIKWRFVTGIRMFHGWISDRTAVSGIGRYYSSTRSTIGIPIGFMYSAKSGFFVGFDYNPNINLADGSIDIYGFRFRLGFEALMK
jgi:hypothetical protein